MPAPKNEPWSVARQKQRQTEEKNTMPFRGAIFSKVLSPSAEEEVLVDSAIGRLKMSFAYPFASTNAWIRGQPETTTTMLSIVGGDSKDLQPISYFDKTKASAVRAYNRVADAVRDNPSAAIPDILPYRPLSPGDLDVGSRFAQLFLGGKDVFQARGGLSHIVATSQEAQVETPLWRVTGPAHVHGSVLNDEVRFGVVRRVTPTRSPTFPALVRGPGVSVRNPLAQPFAKESSMALTWQGLPSTLLDHRQGIVVEDDGTLARSTFTGQLLRARFRWKSLLSETSVEVDEQGNWAIATANSATTGAQVTVPTGSFSLQAGQRVALRSGTNMDLEATGAWSASGLQGFTLSTPSRGTVRALQGLSLQSLGVVSIESPLPSGIQLGSPGALKFPVLVGTPAFLSTLSAGWSAQAAADGTAATYAGAAAAAWSAIGPLMMAIDPSGTISSLCLAAAGAAGANIASQTAAAAAIGAHMPTLAPSPVGFVSTKTISE